MTRHSTASLDSDHPNDRRSLFTASTSAMPASSSSPSRRLSHSSGHASLSSSTSSFSSSSLSLTSASSSTSSSSHSVSSRLYGCVVLLCVVLLGVCGPRSVSGSAALYVDSPDSLINDVNAINKLNGGSAFSGEVLGVTGALFGNPNYENMYSGYLVWAGNGKLTPPGGSDPINAQYGCGTYDLSTNQAWNDLNDDPSVRSIILLVDRNPTDGSNCLFSDKVYYAQQANAKVSAVLIGDVRNNTAWPTYMKADSRSLSVSLPSMFVQYAYADALRGQAQRSYNADPIQSYAIRIELEFYIPNPDDRVEYDLYYNILNQQTIPFLTTYGQVGRVLRDRALFTPHYMIEDGGPLCRGTPPQWSKCADNCLHPSPGNSDSKWYCLHPSSEKSSRVYGISGVAALNEILREQCIYQQLTSTACPYAGGDCTWMFWSYLEAFYGTNLNCPSTAFSEDCSQKAFNAMTALNLAGKNFQPSWAAVKTCTVAWNIAGATTIPSLDAEMKTWTLTGPFIEPQLYVNQFVYSGNEYGCKTPITEESCGILPMMCYGYKNDSNYPIECNYPNNCPFGQQSCNAPVIATTSGSGISAGAVVGIVLAFLFIGGIIGYYFHKKSQDKTKADVDALLKQYLPMDPGQTHGVAQGASKLREQHERRLIQDMDLEDQELETTDEV